MRTVAKGYAEEMRFEKNFKERRKSNDVWINDKWEYGINIRVYMAVRSCNSCSSKKNLKEVLNY